MTSVSHSATLHQSHHPLRLPFASCSLSSSRPNQNTILAPSSSPSLATGPTENSGTRILDPHHLLQDPCLCRSLVGVRLTIRTRDNNLISGYLHSVDSTLGHVLLCDFPPSSTTPPSTSSSSPSSPVCCCTSSTTPKTQCTRCTPSRTGQSGAEGEITTSTTISSTSTGEKGTSVHMIMRESIQSISFDQTDHSDQLTRIQQAKVTTHLNSSSNNTTIPSTVTNPNGNHHQQAPKRFLLNPLSTSPPSLVCPPYHRSSSSSPYYTHSLPHTMSNHQSGSYSYSGSLPVGQELTAEKLRERRDQMRQNLTRSNVPFTEETNGTFDVLGTKIQPPYTGDSIYTNNMVIMERLRRMLFG